MIKAEIAENNIEKKKIFPDFLCALLPFLAINEIPPVKSATAPSGA